MWNKKGIEETIVKEFVKGENVIPPYHDSYSLVSLGDSPDAIIKGAKGKEIGLEVTSAYYDKSRGPVAIKKTLQDTKEGKETVRDSRGNLLWRDNPHYGPVPIRLDDVMENPDGKLASFVQNKLNDKCQKDYGPRCILIIFLYAPLGTERTVTEIRKTVSIPQRNPFFEIYIGFEVPSSTLFFHKHYDGKLTFFRIYPTTDKLYNLDEQELSVQKARHESEERKQWIKLINMPDEEFNKLCESVQI